MPKTKEEKEALKAKKQADKEAKKLEKEQIRNARKDRSANMKEAFKQTKVGKKFVAAKKAVDRAEVRAKHKKEALKAAVKNTAVYKGAKDVKDSLVGKIKESAAFKKLSATEGYDLLKSLPGLIESESELDTLNSCKEAKSTLETILKKRAEFFKLLKGMDLSSLDKAGAKKVEKAISVGKSILELEKKYKSCCDTLTEMWYDGGSEDNVGFQRKDYASCAAILEETCGELSDLRSEAEYARNFLSTIND